MFEIGWGELLVIGVVALIAIGPKELPAVLRTIGQWMGKIRRMASEFQGQFQEAMREAEMSDLKKQVDEMTDTAKGYTNFDPIGTVRNEIEGAMTDKPAAATEAAAPTVPDAPEPASPQAPPAEPATEQDASAAPHAPEPKSKTGSGSGSGSGAGGAA
jgi:sec-independent protein translocase protein TatB